jgi:Tol biopolymer transport system component
LRPEDPRVSPDGRWVAFLDRTSSDVWVRSLTGDALLQVSTASTGGNTVEWSPDSRHLLHSSGDGVTVIELQTVPTLSVVKRWTQRALPPNLGYALAPDGKTFAVVTPVRFSTDIFVAVNWVDDARREWLAGEKKE